MRKGSQIWVRIAALTRTSTDALDEAKGALNAVIEQWKANPTVLMPSTGRAAAAHEPLTLKTYLAVYNILKSRHVYSGNIGDIAALKGQVHRIAKLNRLPEANSLEATVILRQAWNCIDIFNHSADSFKLITKIAYLLLLLAGACISIVTVVGLNQPDIIPRAQMSRIVMGACSKPLSRAHFSVTPVL